LTTDFEENQNGSSSRTSLFSLALLAAAVLIYAGNTYHYHIDRWDDAYITFRFAQHLADGQGLIWNLGGEAVEGFTSLLHVLLLAFGMEIGVDPYVWSLVLSTASVIGTVALMLTIVRRQFGKIYPLAVVPIAMYLIEWPTAMHTTSGLETQIFVVILCAICFFALSFIESHSWSAVLGMSATVFLACLCRPEAVIYSFATYLALAVYSIFVERSGANKELILKLSVSAGLITVAALIYAAWKFNYFGYLLPNPFYVKSSKLSLAGLDEVTDYLKELIRWFAPLTVAAIAIYFIAGSRSEKLSSLIGKPKLVAGFLVLALPPLFALAYYATIIHEVGGSYRFSYPTFFYFALIAALFLSHVQRSVKFSRWGNTGLVAVGLITLGLLFVSQKSWRVDASPPSDFNEYHWQIADVLRDTGLGSRATILCDAAGVIPYVSGFNQLDRVGLTENHLSGRVPLTPVEREAYIWSRPIDVYFGYEPPALPDAKGPEDDPRMRTAYVEQILLRKKLKRVEARIMVQDPELLHARMRELRDHWILVGESDFPGWRAWRLKHFVYVRRDSQFVSLLISKLNELITVKPDAIELNDLSEK